MNRHEFRLSSYVTLAWQLAAVSAAVAYVVGLFLEGDMNWLVWMLPLLVLAMSAPYLVRAVEMAVDLRHGARSEACLCLRDVSEEYAIAFHRHRGMVHWTLIFEDKAQPGRLLSLSAAARRDEKAALFGLGEDYVVEWLPRSRVIRAIRRARRGDDPGAAECGNGGA